MDAKEYLNKLILLKKDLEEKQLLFEVEQNSGNGPLIKDIFVKTDRNIRAEEDRIYRLISLQKDVEQAERNYLRYRSEVENYIQLVNPTEAKLVLHLRYLSELKWSNIADKLKYSKRRIYQLHTKGLSCLENLLNSNH